MDDSLVNSPLPLALPLKTVLRRVRRRQKGDETRGFYETQAPSCMYTVVVCRRVFVGCRIKPVVVVRRVYERVGERMCVSRAYVERGPRRRALPEETKRERRAGTTFRVPLQRPRELWINLNLYIFTGARCIRVESARMDGEQDFP